MTTETAKPKSSIEILYRIFTLVAAFLCLASAAGLLLWSLYLRSVGSPSQELASAWAGTAFMLMLLAGLPGMVWAWRNWSGPMSRPSRSWIAAMLIIPVGTTLTFLPISGVLVSPLLGSFAYALTMGAIILGFILMVRWIGPALTPRRAWGHFLVGFWGMPLIASVAEVLILLPSLLILGLGIALSPDGQTLLDLSSSLTADPQAIGESILTVSMQPWVVGLTFLNFAFVVPILEESVKTLASLPLLRRRITPAQGFVGGALAGAGFALFEALFVAEPGAAGIAMLVGRTGTTLMHMLTAAMTNWALVRAHQNRKWGGFALVLMASVGMHAIWNASSVGIGLAALSFETDAVGASSGFAMLTMCAGLTILVLLSGLALFALPWLSRRLNQADSSPT